jgi:hypothetical protein
MSRHVLRKENITVAYGYDDMMPAPLGGYFFQVFDDEEISDRNLEGCIINEGMAKGISRNRMAELMIQWGVSNKRHLKAVALDLPL